MIINNKSSALDNSALWMVSVVIDKGLDNKGCYKRASTFPAFMCIVYAAKNKASYGFTICDIESRKEGGE